MEDLSVVLKELCDRAVKRSLEANFTENPPEVRLAEASARLTWGKMWGEEAFCELAIETSFASIARIFTDESGEWSVIERLKFRLEFPHNCLKTLEETNTRLQLYTQVLDLALVLQEETAGKEYKLFLRSPAEIAAAEAAAITYRQLEIALSIVKDHTPLSAGKSRQLDDSRFCALTVGQKVEISFGRGRYVVERSANAKTHTGIIRRIA